MTASLVKRVATAMWKAEGEPEYSGFGTVGRASYDDWAKIVFDQIAALGYQVVATPKPRGASPTTTAATVRERTLGVAQIHALNVVAGFDSERSHRARMAQLRGALSAYGLIEWAEGRWQINDAGRAALKTHAAGQPVRVKA